MDVETAPLLVKRRGMKRHLLNKEIISYNNQNNYNKTDTLTESSLCLVSNYADKQLKFEGNNNRPKTLIFQQESFEDVTFQPTTSNNTTPYPEAFIKYRDTKPLYLKYSRDDFDSDKISRK